MSTSVCLSVTLSVLSHNSKTAQPHFTKFLCMLPVARSSFDGIAIRYVPVLPVLRMTSLSCHKHDVMIMRSFPHGDRTTSLGGPLPRKQCCCPGHGAPVDSGPSQRLRKQSAVMPLVHYAVSLEEVRCMYVKIA